MLYKLKCQRVINYSVNTNYDTCYLTVRQVSCIWSLRSCLLAYLQILMQSYSFFTNPIFMAYVFCTNILDILFKHSGNKKVLHGYIMTFFHLSKRYARKNNENRHRHGKGSNKI